MLFGRIVGDWLRHVGGAQLHFSLTRLCSITLVVPFPAGAATDAVARIVSERMAKTLGQAIVIECDAGAGGTTGEAGRSGGT
mgnify:CR=1 FL=1